MKFTFFLFFLFFIPSCAKDKNFTIQNLNNNKISVFGHGGMGISHLYPMNSFEGIAQALALGADGTEIDIQITSDSVLLGYHDKDLKEQSNCVGFINDKTWNEIQKCTYVRQPYSNYHIISLESLFSNIPNLHSYTFTFDCKLYINPSNNFKQYLESFANAIVRIIEKYHLEENIFIESENKDFLKILQQKSSTLKLFIYPPSFGEGIKIAEELNLYGITISIENINKEQMALAHSLGFRVAIWNTRTPKKNIQGIEKNPDFIQTDKLEHLLKILK